jgi:hypothetical protein
MKKLIYLLGIIIVFGACDSLVEEEVFSTITPNNFFQNEADITTSMVGVYDGIQDVNLWWRMFYTSEMTGGLLRHQWSPSQESLIYEDDFGDAWNVWLLNYEAISRANAVLSALEGSSLDDDIVNRYKGEARFIRAYVYFNMVRLFGQIPLVTQSPESIDDVLVPETTDTDSDAYESEFLKQRDRDDIYAFIVEDLQFAEESLPTTVEDSELGRVTSGAAAGLLAKVYLTMAGQQYDYNAGQLVDGDESKYSLAAQQCTKVISQGKYSLLDDYANVYEVANNDEILFAIQYMSIAEGGISGEGNQIVARTGIAKSEITPYAWLQCSINETFWQDFVANNTKEDKRYERTFLEYYVESDGDTISYGSSRFFMRPHVRKFLTDLGPDQAATGSTDYSADWIVLRYADVLLMESEALNESEGPTASALEGINEVRDRAGLDAIELGVSKDELRELIWQERRWELCFEGHHYFDCMRTGRLLEEFALYPHESRKSDATIRHYIYPIPYNAMEANPSLNQNAGW